MSAGRVIALDLGTRRIGVALSDEERRIAQPQPMIPREGERSVIIEAICERFVATSSKILVVGWPLQLNGKEGIQTHRVRRFLTALAPVLSSPIHLQDERLSTVEAERVLIEGGARRQTRKEVIDSLAATLILQTWLARWQNGFLDESDLFS